MQGRFVDEGGERWYRIDGLESAAPFFTLLASDSDLWAFISTAGSLAAGRRDADGAFFPYETVDKIHRRWEHTGPRTWIRVQAELWQPFAPLPDREPGRRSVWKNLSGTRLRLREAHPSWPLVFEQEWSTAAELGLVRTARLWSTGAAVDVQVLDGLLNLIPPGLGQQQVNQFSSLTDAYKWNETAAGGRLAMFTLSARIWDRAEPKEAFESLVAWGAGPPALTLLSAHQVAAFCRSGQVEPEALTRGRAGAFLQCFEARIDSAGLQWFQVVDAPCSQVQAFELARRLETGGGTAQEIQAALARNTEGVDQLLACADGLQDSADTLAAAHHRANVLFNIMRGGVFADGTRWQRDDLLAFLQQRHRPLAERLQPLLASWPAQVERADALRAAAESAGPQAERLLLAYLPLTFSRRHGDPSRPWNRFSIRVRDAAGRRVLNHEGNWRDIFQNWEALVPSQPEYLGSMIASFLGAMTPDGYNPYRIGRAGIDWEVVDDADPWSHYGYWGDHQVVYLLRLLEAAREREPGLLPSLWDRSLFSFADVPYRLKAHAEQTAHPKATLHFDAAAHAAAHERAGRIGSDGLLVCDANGEPVLATLAEKLAILLLAKAGSLVPGGGLWLHTQRPEWNDANNALVGQGLSIVTLAHLRRMLAFVLALPGAERPFTLAAATLQALQGMTTLLRQAPPAALHDPIARRAFLDAAGTLLDPWRAQAWRGAAGRDAVQAPAGTLTDLATALLPWVDATLDMAQRPDGLFHSYNRVDLADGQARVHPLQVMLEGQVALLSCGRLEPAQALRLLDALFDSELYCPRRRSFLLYPDRALPGYLERNRLDAEALALPVVQTLLDAGRSDLVQRQSDGTVRFAPALSNRADLLATGADLGDTLLPLAEAYERLLGHAEYTGRSGTMFGYEGLGCIYWHMVAKLLLAVQEVVFDAANRGAPELPALVAHYRRVRDGLGWRKTPAEWGAFPADAYSHTPAEGGAQQPGMTGQVKEEILARWGELGLRMRAGQLHFHPVLLDEAELPLAFTWARVPYRYRRGSATRLRVQGLDGAWHDCPDLRFDPTAVQAVEAEIAFV